MEVPAKTSAESFPNGVVIGTSGASVTNLKSVNCQTASDMSNGSCVSVRHKETAVLPKSSSVSILMTANGGSEVDKQFVGQSPPNSLRLAVSTDCLTPPPIGYLSPLTPSSRFHKCVLSGQRSSLVIATVLCNWDNIFGPRVRCLWITEHEMHTRLTLDLLNFVANQTLSGEIMHDLKTPVLEMKLYTAADKGVALATLVFGAQGRKDLAVHSLSVIVPHNMAQEFFIWKDVSLEWMQRAAQRLRIELSKNVDRAYESFCKTFRDFIHTIESALHAGFPKKVELVDTVLHPHHVFDGEFVRKAIAAHLSQCQQSVVIGSSIQSVNLMVNTLSLFMSPHRKHRCRLLTEDTGDFYSPEFCVQGLMKTDGVVESVMRSVCFSRYPTALIDMAEEKVSLLCLPNEYSTKRRKFILQDLYALNVDTSMDCSLSIDSIFEPMPFDDAIVKEFLKEFHSLPMTHGIREMYVKHFMSSLHRIALALTHLTEAEIKKNSVVHVLTFVPELAQTLSLRFFCDLLIVLCVAELLKPGIMGLICGDELRLDRLMP